MQVKHGYDLVLTHDYGSALTSLDFRGNDTLIAGGKNGRVSILQFTHTDHLQVLGA
jgi:hypothetical protein